MATDVTMPRLSDSMEEGTILKWLVSEGDEVEKGQEIVEIETDKANMTYESDTAGTLIEIVAEEGATLPLGEVIARIGDAGEKPSGKGEAEEADAGGGDEGEEPKADEEEEAEAGDGDQGEDGDESEDAEDAETEEEREAEPATAQDGGEDGDGGDGRGNGGAPEREPARAGADGGDGDGDGRVKASPVARRMASEMGVELAQLEGSGPGGRIVKADVEAAARDGGGDGKPQATEKDEAPAAAPSGKGDEDGARGRTETLELSKLQRTVSRRMAESKATAPDFSLVAEVDMSLCVELRKRLKEVTDPAPSFNDMVVKAAANALREHPRVNGAYRDGKFELYSRVNVGVAVAAQDTLVVPTIPDADRKSLGEIARKGRELIGKVRDGKVKQPELSGGTFTVSNLGMYGIDSFSAVINPPQAAILTVGSLKRRPVVDDDGRIVARDTMTLTLVCDHRILYGADGAEFLARVRELLEQPLALAL